MDRRGVRGHFGYEEPRFEKVRSELVKRDLVETAEQVSHRLGYLCGLRPLFDFRDQLLTEPEMRRGSSNQGHRCDPCSEKYSGQICTKSNPSGTRTRRISWSRPRTLSTCSKTDQVTTMSTD